MLRFADAAPPPDLVGRPPAAAPPHPVMAEESEPDAAKPVRKKDIVVPSPAAQASVAIEPSTNSAPDGAKKPAPGTSEAPAPEVHTPPPILQDDLHPQTRPEDFLPFFQIPTAQPGDPNAVVPVPRAPAPLPQSSATYTQTPK